MWNSRFLKTHLKLHSLFGGKAGVSWCGMSDVLSRESRGAGRLGIFYTQLLSLFFWLECSCFTSYSASVLVSAIQGSESVTRMHISSHKIPPPTPRVLYPVEFYTSTKRVLLLWFHRQGRWKSSERPGCLLGITQLTKQRSHQIEIPTWALHMFMVAPVVGVIVKIFTWSKFKSFNDLSAVWHAGPLISLSLFPFLQKWRK